MGWNTTRAAEAPTAPAGTGDSSARYSSAWSA